MNLSTKAAIRQFLIYLKDIIAGTPFAQPRQNIQFNHTITLSQPFKPSSTLEGKKHNLREAASRINEIVVNPGEVFSFWHIVGNPNDATRFTEGRSIHAGKTTKDYGGGLCQASGIIHHIALMTNLQVVERHNHSVDLYTEQTRFAPLGTDATVFYGFKDLRIINNYPFAIKFILTVNDNDLTLQMISEAEIKPYQLEIDVKETSEGKKLVKVRRDGVLTCESCYQPI